VISKLVSRRQEELTEEIHRTTFEDRLDRVRTNLHLVFSDLGSVQQLQAEQGVLPDLVLRRLESTVRVFRGELVAVHDVLYRSRIAPDEGSRPGCGGKSILRHPSQKYFFHNCLITNAVVPAKG
jgi:hypothetical protein